MFPSSKTSYSDWKLKMHFWRRKNNFTSLFQAFDGDSVYVGNSIKAYIWKVECTKAKEGRQQSERKNALIKKDWGAGQCSGSGKCCGLVQLYSTSRNIIRYIHAVLTCAFAKCYWNDFSALHSIFVQAFLSQFAKPFKILNMELVGPLSIGTPEFD